MFYGVVTADIKGSRSLSVTVYDALIDRLEAFFGSLEEHHIDAEIYRGDAFQLVGAPKEVLRAALRCKLLLKAYRPAVEVKVSYAVGTIEKRRNRLGSSIGEAFLLSGQCFEQMRGRLFSVTSSNEVFNDAVSLVTQFLDHHLQGLSIGQARALFYYLSGDYSDHADLARALSCQRPNATRLLNAAKYKLLEEYLEHIDKNFQRHLLSENKNAPC